MDDTNLQQAAADALRLNSLIPAAVHAEVRHGFITLRGEVGYHYERMDAGDAVRYLPGVRAVVNEIVVRPPAVPRLEA